VPGGDFIRLETPGGGGFGDPAERDPEHVALDVANGLSSRKAAERDYRVALGADGNVNWAETERLRGLKGRDLPDDTHPVRCERAVVSDDGDALGE